jgi:spermidine/putrescine transport system ATP-binding protein
MNAPVVELRNVAKQYGPVVAVEDISLAVHKGEFVVLLGPSGSGKTTLLSMLGGFVPPSRGEILIEGTDVTGKPPAQRPTVTVFQDYALFPNMTVRNNVAFGLAMRRMPKPQRNELARAAIAQVGLAGFGDRRIHELSGGQRQRVALARAIVIEPAVLLLDEPLGALDVKIRRQMQTELHGLQRDLHATFIHVTHDQEEAMSLADTIVLLNNGRIEDAGPPERIYREPASVFAATFMGDTNIVRGTVAMAAGGKVMVDTAVGTLTCRGNGRPGEPVCLSLRPETIRCGKASGRDKVLLGTGRLSDFVFQGTFRRCHAVAGPDASVKLQLRLPQESEIEPEAQTPIWTRSSDIVLLRENAE